MPMPQEASYRIDIFEGRDKEIEELVLSDLEVGITNRSQIGFVSMLAYI